MRVLVTGAGGLLGTAITEELSGFRNYQILNFSRTDLDVTDRSKVFSALEVAAPDVVIHTAGLTDVEYCETHPDEAYLVNTIATQHLVDAIKGTKIKFVYISSTGIYGKEKNNAPYTEFDRVTPTTVHHKSKWAAEQVVSAHLSDYLLIRVGWLFGGTTKQKKNFVFQRIVEANRGGDICSDGSQFGNPTYVVNLVKQLDVMITNNLQGVFNCVNSERASRYDYVSEIFSNIPNPPKLKSVDSNYFNRVAPVSHNEAAVNYKLDLMGLNVMGPWRSELFEYIKNLQGEFL